MLNVLAVDLGASSIRVAVVDLDARPLTPRILHRFEHAPVRHDDGSQRWDWSRIIAEVTHGLELGLGAAPIASIGVDAWGVDYGLLDANGELLSPPYAYRDARTDSWRETVERIGAERLYRTTGIQLMPINTIFQLAAHDRTELSRTRRLLMLPELLVHALTGATMGERTSAGITALVDIATGDWSPELLAEVAVDPAIMPKISPATTYAGTWRGIPVHLVGGHDTASAVAALPSPAANAAFISSGTWMLVGAERDMPDRSAAAMRANFSNEPGVFGNVRFLKNIMGLWMLEQCRAQWNANDLNALMSATAKLPPGGPTLDATDERFLAPQDMEAEVRSAAGLPPSAGRDVVARCILDALASSAATVMNQLHSVTGNRPSEIVIVGGGAHNTLLNSLIADATNLPVRTGPTEATLLGNALTQGVALGRFDSLADARLSLSNWADGCIVPHMVDVTPKPTPDDAAPAGDVAFVARLRAGDEMAFADLIAMYHRSLLRMARQYVDSAVLADEVVQDTWIALLESLTRFEGRSSLKTWLYRILLNVARARRRKEARSIPFSAAFPAEDNQSGDSPGFYPGWFPKVGGAWINGPARWQEQPEHAVLSSELHDLIERAVAALPPSQREVITLRDIEGFGAEEVCNLLAISDTNQRVLLHRARTRVRKALAPQMTEQSGERQ